MTIKAMLLLRLHKVIDALSQLANVILFGGEANYSVSGDAYRLSRKKLEKAINFCLKWYEQDHCFKSYVADIQRAIDLLEEDKKRRGIIHEQETETEK